jgi:hypothetical protein
VNVKSARSEKAVDRNGDKEFRANQVSRVYRFAAPKAPSTPDLPGKTVAVAIDGDLRDAASVGVGSN